MEKVKNIIKKVAFDSSTRWTRMSKGNTFNPFGAMAMFSLQYIPNTETLIKEIQVPEWEFPSVDTQNTWNVKRLANLLQDVTHRYDFGSGQIAILLSGGIDSRLILALLLERFSPEQIIAVTFGEPSCRDMVIASLIAKQCGIKHFKLSDNHIYSVKHGSYYIQATRGEAPLSFIGPMVSLILHDIFRDLGISCIANGIYGNIVHAVTPNLRVRATKLIVRDSYSCFCKDYAKQYNQQAYLSIKDAKSDIQRTNLFAQAYSRRYMSLLLHFIEQEGYKVFVPFLTPKFFSAITSIPIKQRTRKWQAEILYEINASLCKIPDQMTCKAWTGNKQISKGLRYNWLNYYRWLYGCKDWAMNHYCNAEAFEAFGIESERIRKIAEGYFNCKGVNLKTCWRLLLFGLNLSLFYNLVQEGKF